MLNLICYKEFHKKKPENRKEYLEADKHFIFSLSLKTGHFCLFTFYNKNLIIVFMSKIIFLVEDHQTLNDAIRIRLEKLGYEIIACLDGRSLLEKIKGTTPDLIILDIDLPDFNGLDLLSQIRNTRGLDTVRFLILTGLTEKKSATALSDESLKRKLGVSAYISKPFATEDLVNKVKELLQ